MWTPPFKSIAHSTARSQTMLQVALCPTFYQRCFFYSFAKVFYLHVFLHFLCIFACFYPLWYVFVLILCGNFSACKFCLCYSFSFYHLCSVHHLGVLICSLVNVSSHNWPNLHLKLPNYRIISLLLTVKWFLLKSKVSDCITQILLTCRTLNPAFKPHMKYHMKYHTNVNQSVLAKSSLKS